MNILSEECRLKARQTKMYVCTLEELYSCSISCSLYNIWSEHNLELEDTSIYTKV